MPPNSETDPLLASSTTQSPIWKSKKFLILIVCSLITLSTDFGIFMSNAPQTAIFEEIICRNYQANLHRTGAGDATLDLGTTNASRLDVVILDNVFSGLDSTSIALLTNRPFGKDGHFKKLGISVILAVSTDQLLLHVDQILMMEEGKITASGSYNEILSEEPNIASNSQKRTSDVSLATAERSNSGLAVVKKKPTPAFLRKQPTIKRPSLLKINEIGPCTNTTFAAQDTVFWSRF
ncbi:unnamed protein product [Penicillium glandicola]